MFVHAQKRNWWPLKNVVVDESKHRWPPTSPPVSELATHIERTKELYAKTEILEFTNDWENGIMELFHDLML